MSPLDSLEQIPISEHEKTEIVLMCPPRLCVCVSTFVCPGSGSYIPSKDKNLIRMQNIFVSLVGKQPSAEKRIPENEDAPALPPREVKFRRNRGKQAKCILMDTLSLLPACVFPTHDRNRPHTPFRKIATLGCSWIKITFYTVA